MDERYKQMRLMEIEQEIKKAESSKSGGVVMMVVSIFFLRPLLIAGIVVYNNANKKINELNEEKKRIMFEDWVSKSNETK